jgi:hypothetical protein
MKHMEGWRAAAAGLLAAVAVAGVGLAALVSATEAAAGIDPFPTVTAVPDPTSSPSPGCPHPVPTVLTWTGASSPYWTTDTTVLNWRDAAGQAMPYCDGDVAVFDDTASQRTVVVQPDGVRPGEVDFVGYRDFVLDGTGEVGITGLTDVYTYLFGTLTILNRNSFVGEFQQRGSVVEINTGDALGKGRGVITKGELRAVDGPVKVDIPITFDAPEPIHLTARVTDNSALALAGAVTIARDVRIRADGPVFITGKVVGKKLTLEFGRMSLTFAGNTHNGTVVKADAKLGVAPKSAGAGPVMVDPDGELRARGEQDGPFTVNGALYLTGDLTIKNKLVAGGYGALILADPDDGKAYKLAVGELELGHVAISYRGLPIGVTGKVEVTGRPVLHVADVPAAVANNNRVLTVIAAGQAVPADSLWKDARTPLKEKGTLRIQAHTYEITYLDNGGKTVALKR